MSFADLRSCRGIDDLSRRFAQQQFEQLRIESADFAESAPEPELHELYTDVLVEHY